MNGKLPGPAQTLSGVFFVAILLVLAPLSSSFASEEGGGRSDGREQMIVSRLLEKNRWRERHLQDYTVARDYILRSPEGQTKAKAQVVLEYRAPASKQFKTISEDGSMVGAMVFRQLQETEEEQAKAPNRAESSITPENYRFTFLREEMVDGHRCYAVALTPLRKDRWLIEGTMWVHATDFAIIRISGRVVKNPSWWLKNIDFVRRYEKVGDFWMPVRDETVTQVRLMGKNFLTIDYHNYRINSGAAPAPAKPHARNPMVDAAASVP